MHLPKRLISKHRRARLIAWSLATLAWLAWVFCADRAPKRRHMRRRYGFISLDRLARTLALLIVLRAAEFAGVRRNHRFRSRVRGRKAWVRHAARSVIGGRLRRALKHKDFAARIALLTDAARRLDAWAASHVARLRRGMSRLWAIPARPQPAARLASLTLAPVFAADSS